MSFIDDHTQFTWVYFLRHNNEVFAYFQTFYDMVETQFKVKINVSRSDSGREYMSKKDFQVYMNAKGIISQNSCLDTPNKIRSLNVK